MNPDTTGGTQADVENMDGEKVEKLFRLRCVTVFLGGFIAYMVGSLPVYHTGVPTAMIERYVEPAGHFILLAELGVLFLYVAGFVLLLGSVGLFFWGDGDTERMRRFLDSTSE